MSRHQPNIHERRARFESLYRSFQESCAKRDFVSALEAAKQARTISNSPEVAHAEALCLLRISRPQEAYDLVKAIPSSSDNEDYFDLLAEICGALGKADELKATGSKALAIRDRKFANGIKYPIPDASRHLGTAKRIIAFSLFGNSPRYCEAGIINCHAATRWLPGWQCRFYCDETVPTDVSNRIVAAGGEIHILDEATRLAIPPLMWRFLAADDPVVSHFLMRDADSIIGEREAAAVNAWLVSGKAFHVMRDYYTHSELMLAGLWGGRTGIIPSMRQEIVDFVAQGRFSPSHVDQHFLRARIWPTARQSVLSHDSQFAFFNNEPFPHVPDASQDPKHHVGANTSTCSIGGRLERTDGTTARISIYDEHQARVCIYEVPVQQQRWQLPVPDSYAEKIERREWRVIVN